MKAKGPRTASSRPIETAQIKRIKGLQRKRDMNDTEYRQMLEELYEAPSCKSLMFDQAEHFIAVLEGRKPLAPMKPKKQVATYPQIKLLRFYAMACGIHYAPMHAWQLTDGRVLQGDELREWIRARYLMERVGDEWRPKDLGVPKPLLTQLYKDWINAKANEMLVERQFKREAKSPNVLYYEELSPDECSYLINRFRAMWQVIESQRSTTI